MAMAVNRLWVGKAGRACLLAALVPIAGCATKRDVRDLEEQIAQMRARQDSLLRVIEQQDRAVLDSVGALRDAVISVRGDIGNELAQMEQQHVQIMELTGESQRALTQVRQSIASRAAQLQQPEDTTGGAATTSANGDSSQVAQLYQIGMDNLGRGATSTARQAFQQIVRDHQDSPLAPDAQFALAETYYRDKQYDQAMRELERVVEMFPGSARAPAALYRAGVIAEEQGNVSKAREYFRRVIAGYPKSDEAKRASEELRRLQK
jgi:tol-pal system protein YbgF